MRYYIVIQIFGIIEGGGAGLMHLDNSSCGVPLALEIAVRYGVCCRLCPHPYRCNEYRNADAFTSVVGGGWQGWGGARMGPSPQAPESKGR
jgi:hypothetical protein